MTALRRPRKTQTRDPFKAAAEAVFAVDGAANLVRDLDCDVDRMVGSERVVAALLELRRVVDATVSRQVLR